MTEMLKGTLEGIVLAILSGRPAYGYEITAGCGDGLHRHCRGTRRGSSDEWNPRTAKVYSLNVQGQGYLEEFWRTWSFLTNQLEQLREGGS